MKTQTHSNMVITVTCPSCSSSFPVDPAKVPEGGVNARCSSCGDIFRIEKPATAPPLPTLEGIEPVAPEPPAGEVAHSQPPAPPAQPAPSDEAYVDEAPHIPAIMEEEPASAPAAPPPLPAPTTPSQETAAPPPLPAPTTPSQETAAPPPLPDPPVEAAAAPPAPEPAEAVPPPLPDPVAVAVDPEPAPAATPPAYPEANTVGAEPPAAQATPTHDEALGGPTPLEEAAPPPAEPLGVSAFTFGKRDPTDKAKRLARVLVSDMIMYNAERHQSALAAGTLVQDFEDEIEKSWKEFVDQVGEDLANGPGRGFWTEALNDILAKGQRVF
jgi:predicted Zn finger-like uncharacterized protein